MERAHKSSPMGWDELFEIVRTSEHISSGSSNRLEELGRSTEQQSAYTSAMQTLRTKYASVGDYVLISKFGLRGRSHPTSGLIEVIREGPLSTSSRIETSVSSVVPVAVLATSHQSTQPAQHAETVLALNDFPYYFTPDLMHFVLWKRDVTSSVNFSAHSNNGNIHDVQPCGNRDITQEDITRAHEQLRATYGRRCAALLHWVSPPELRSVPELSHAHIILRTSPSLNTAGSATEGPMSQCPSTADVSPAHQHLLLPPTQAGISAAAARLLDGGLVAFPTETVYGLGANALDAAAVLSIFTAKGRPLTDPLIVHVHSPAAAAPLIELTPDERVVFDELASAFWPGPLTLIVRASALIPLIVTAQTGFVGVRVPNHYLARQLLQACIVPVAAPSANRFGHVSPTRAAHVLLDLGDRGVHVLDGEYATRTSVEEAEMTCEHGIESTVVRIDGALRQLIIYRQGAVTAVQLQAALRTTKNADREQPWSVLAVQRHVKMEAHSSSIAPVQQEPQLGQEAPGQAITHYAPDVPCYLVERGDTTAASLLAVPVPLSQCVILDFAGCLQDCHKLALAYRDLSMTGSAQEAARHLFDALRWAELQTSARCVLLASPCASFHATAPAPAATQSDEVMLGQELMLGLCDRMHRAASGRWLGHC